MSVLVRCMEMPQGSCEWVDKDGHLHRCKLLSGDDDCKMQEGICADATWKEQFAGCPLVEVPPHSSLIDKNELYEKVAKWEAQALEQASKLAQTDNTKEWRRWSTILNERTAFKFDVIDAPVVIEGNME